VSVETPIVLDGLSTVRAVRHAGGQPREARFQAPRTRPPPKQPADDDALRATRIGHTAVPTRAEIVCYQCGYAFVIQGRIAKPLCPKCHEFLNTDDLVIASDWAEDVRTIGRITVKPEAVVHGARLSARDIVLAGNARECALLAFRRLELRPGAQLDWDRTEMLDLVVAGGMAVTPGRALNCRQLDLAGKLDAVVAAGEAVTIRAGGLLVGEVRSPRLIVEDGGGLRAQVHAGGRAVSCQ
jgi:hypothetical protein